MNLSKTDPMGLFALLAKLLGVMLIVVVLGVIVVRAVRGYNERVEYDNTVRVEREAASQTCAMFLRDDFHSRRLGAACIYEMRDRGKSFDDAAKECDVVPRDICMKGLY